MANLVVPDVTSSRLHFPYFLVIHKPTHQTMRFEMNGQMTLALLLQRLRTAYPLFSIVGIDYLDDHDALRTRVSNEMEWQGFVQFVKSRPPPVVAMTVLGAATQTDPKQQSDSAYVNLSISNESENELGPASNSGITAFASPSSNPGTKKQNKKPLSETERKYSALDLHSIKQDVQQALSFPMIQSLASTGNNATPTTNAANTTKDWLVADDQPIVWPMLASVDQAMPTKTNESTYYASIPCHCGGHKSLFCRCYEAEVVTLVPKTLESSKQRWIVQWKIKNTGVQAWPATTTLACLTARLSEIRTVMPFGMYGTKQSNWFGIELNPTMIPMNERFVYFQLMYAYDYCVQNTQNAQNTNQETNVGSAATMCKMNKRFGPRFHITNPYYRVL